MAEKPKIYFGTDVTKKFIIDKDQWLEHKKMNEGQKRLYESLTSQEIKMNQATQEISMDMRLGEDRKALFDCTVIGYRILWENADTVLEGKKENNSWTDQAQWEKIRDGMPSDIAMGLYEDIADLNGFKKK